jgi:hypothetical protein
MAKKELYYDRAKRLFFRGKTVRDISLEVPVSYRVLKTWKREGEWEKRRDFRMLPGRRASDILRDRIEEKIQELDKNITSADVDEIAKMTASIERLENRTSDMRGAAVEIMEWYAQFLKGKLSAEKLREHSELILCFFEYLEENL